MDVLMKKILNLLTILGLFLLTASFVIRQYEALNDRKYESAKGTVTEVWTTSFNASAEYYYFCPRIEFTTADEREIVHYAPCTTGMSDYKQGQEFEVRYNPMDPGDVHLIGVQVKREWFNPRYSTFLFVLGLLLLLAGMIQALQRKRSE
jgi:hypothetical protein